MPRLFEHEAAFYGFFNGRPLQKTGIQRRIHTADLCIVFGRYEFYRTQVLEHKRFIGGVTVTPARRQRRRCKALHAHYIIAVLYGLERHLHIGIGNVQIFVQRFGIQTGLRNLHLIIICAGNGSPRKGILFFRMNDNYIPYAHEFGRRKCGRYGQSFRRRFERFEFAFDRHAPKIIALRQNDPVDTGTLRFHIQYGR